MNAPSKAAKAATLAPVLAAVAATARRDPASLHVPTPKGVAGVLVLFGPPTTKPTPAALRLAFEDACDRAKPRNPSEAAHVEACAKFVDTLPDVVTPVAALGIAVRAAKEKDSEWVHNMTREKHARWTYCASHVTTNAVSINGAGTCAEAYPDGRLVIEPGVPSHIAAMLQAEYDRARGVVETTRVNAIVSAYLAKAGGQAITSSSYLLPETTSATCGVLAGLSDLGGTAITYPVADADKIAELAAPVTRSIEEQIAAVVEKTREFIANATDVAKPDSTKRMQERSGETVRANILAARKAAELWQGRLQLAAFDVADTLDALDKAADEADKAALAAIKKRRENAKLAREVAALTSSTPKSAATEADEDACGFVIAKAGDKTPNGIAKTAIACALPKGHKGPHDDGEGFRVDDNGRVIPLPGAVVSKRTLDTERTGLQELNAKLANAFGMDGSPPPSKGAKGAKGGAK